MAQEEEEEEREVPISCLGAKGAVSLPLFCLDVQDKSPVSTLFHFTFDFFHLFYIWGFLNISPGNQLWLCLFFVRLLFFLHIIHGLWLLFKMKAYHASVLSSHSCSIAQAVHCIFAH